MVESHYEILWANKLGAGLGIDPSAYYVARTDDPEKQAIIAQQRHRYKMLELWVKNFLATDAKWMWRAFRTAYTFNTQYDGAGIIFVIVKMVRPDTHAGWSDIKYKPDTTNMSQFKHNIPRANQQILEVMNNISIPRETYSEIVRHKLNLYSTSSWTLFKDYMDTKRSEWEEYKESTWEQVMTIALESYNKLLTSGRWSKKYPKDAHTCL